MTIQMDGCGYHNIPAFSSKSVGITNHEINEAISKQ